MSEESTRSKRASWDKSFLDEIAESERCLQLTERQIVALLSVVSNQMQWDTRWHNAPVGYGAKFAGALAYALLTAKVCKESTQTEKLIIVGNISEESEEENMPHLTIEYIAGQPFLEMDCGCGSKKYFALTESSVNPQTGAPSNALDTPPAYLQPPLLSDGTQLDCYDAAMASTVVQALITFTEYWFNYGVLGAAAFIPGGAALIGAVEVAQMLVKALNGELTLSSDNIGYTDEEVIDVFTGEAFALWLVQQFGGKTALSRQDLIGAGQKLFFNSSLNFPTPIQPVYMSWAYAVNITELNAKLTIAASECVTGNSLIYPYVPSQTIVTFDGTAALTGNSGGNLQFTAQQDRADYSFVSASGIQWAEAGFTCGIVATGPLVSFDVRLNGRIAWANWHNNNTNPTDGTDYPSTGLTTDGQGVIATPLESGLDNGSEYAIYRFSGFTGNPTMLSFGSRQCGFEGCVQRTLYGELIIQNVITA